MATFQEWKAQQAQQLAARQELVARSRSEWVGRGVWYVGYAGYGMGGCYGEIEEIGDSGTVRVSLGYDEWGHKRTVHASLEQLGNTITLIDA